MGWSGGAVREVGGRVEGRTGGSVGGEVDDALEQLGDEIATLSAHIHAATHRLLVLIAEFDRRRGWELAGYRNCSQWLAARTGIDPGAAREKVRAARALEELPETSRAMARGELSFSQVRALTRVADAGNEAQLLELARGTTTAALERVVRAWKMGGRVDEAEQERERWRARTFSVFAGEDGMYVVTGRVTAEVGALLMRAVEAASDALYRGRHGERQVGGAAEAQEAARASEAAAAGGGDLTGTNVVGSGVPERCGAKDAVPEGSFRRGARDGVHEGRSSRRAKDTGREAARRRADALALVAERALAAGFGRAEPAGTGGCTAGGAEGDCRMEAAEAEARNTERVAAVAAERPATATAPGGTPGAAPAGAPLSGTRAARYQVVLHVDAGTLSAQGESGRSELEDGTRVSPETSRRIACDAGLVRVVHGGNGSVVDVGRKTRTVPPAPPAEPVAALIAENRRRGVDPDARTLGARWERERDIPDRVYFRALEAL